jgi:hypothetical protein
VLAPIPGWSGPIPGIGNDLLYTVLESESDRPKRPWFKILPLTTTQDPPDFVKASIGLRIETTRDAATGRLVPMFRSGNVPA